MALGWYMDMYGQQKYGETPNATPSPQGNLLDSAEPYKPKVTLDFSKDLGAKADAGRSNIAYMNSVQKVQPIETPEVANTAEVPGAKPASGAQAGAIGAATTAAKGGSAVDTLGGGLLAAGAVPSPASPYLIAGGLALTAASQIKKGKYQDRQDRYVAEVKAYEQKQNAIQEMTNVAKGLRA